MIVPYSDQEKIRFDIYCRFKESFFKGSYFFYFKYV